MLQDLLFRLQDETQAKLSSLLSEEMELRRQLEQLDWMESSLTKQERAMGPMSFLQALARHADVRAELRRAVSAAVLELREPSSHG